MRVLLPLLLLLSSTTLAQEGASGVAQSGASGVAQSGATGVAQAGASGVAQAGTSVVAQGGATGVAQEGSIVVIVEGVSHSRGRVACSLFSSEEGWPSDRSKARAGRWARIRNGRARCVFANMPRGTYAVGTFHDEDNDGSLNTSIVGRPREGWGVSNNVPPRRFGAPEFTPSSFRFDGSTRTVRIRLRY